MQYWGDDCSGRDVEPHFHLDVTALRCQYQQAAVGPRDRKVLTVGGVRHGAEEVTIVFGTPDVEVEVEATEPEVKTSHATVVSSNGDSVTARGVSDAVESFIGHQDFELNCTRNCVQRPEPAGVVSDCEVLTTRGICDAQELTTGKCRVKLNDARLKV